MAVFEPRAANMHVHPASPVEATIRVPGSKSLTNRFLLLAAFAEGESELLFPLESDDTRYMRQALSAAGIETNTVDDGSRWIVQGRRAWQQPAEPIFIGNAGTAMRFLTPAFARLPFPVTIGGNDRMRQRPLGDLGDGLRQLSADIQYPDRPGYPPIEVTGPLKPPTGDAAVQVRGNASSQYLSGLLMTAPMLEKPLRLVVDGELVSKTYVEMTLDCMRHFGVQVEANNSFNAFYVRPSDFQARKITIEPDASTASYWFALPLMTGGAVTVEDVPQQSTQGDFGLLDIFASMGAKVERSQNQVRVSATNPLTGIDVDMNTRSDVAATLAVVATRASSPTMIRNIGNMRIKECDRIDALQTAFDALGLRMESGPDWMRIHPGQPTRTALVNPEEDHRMAMVFALLGLRYGGVTIRDPECVAKTYPGFYEAFASVLTRQ